MERDRLIEVMTAVQNHVSGRSLSMRELCEEMPHFTEFELISALKPFMETDILHITMPMIPYTRFALELTFKTIVQIIDEAEAYNMTRRAVATKKRTFKTVYREAVNGTA